MIGPGGSDSSASWAWCSEPKTPLYVLKTIVLGLPVLDFKLTLCCGSNSSNVRAGGGKAIQV
jgi:hypothetical protein